MAKNSYTVTINVKTDSRGLTELDTKLKNIKTLAKEVEQAVNQIGNKSPKGLNSFGKSVEKVTKQINGYNKALDNTATVTKKSNLKNYTTQIDSMANSVTNTTKKTDNLTKSQQRLGDSTRKTITQQQKCEFFVNGSIFKIYIDRKSVV